MPDQPSLTPESVRERLRAVPYPGYSRDIVSFGIVKDISVAGGDVTVSIHLTGGNPDAPARIKEDCEKALRGMPGVTRADVRIVFNPPPPGGAPMMQRRVEASRIEGVRHVVAVASGKGGVGKSTVAVNLAAALAESGLRVGLCDCDIYGPSVPLMLGTRDPVLPTDDDRILPVEVSGLRLMSMALLMEETAAAVLRGPIVTRYTQEFLRRVVWGPLDILILDLPPGTGDIQLTIAQTVELSGVVLVTTPQEVALADVRRAAAMFEKVSAPILGVIENMSFFLCPDSGKSYPIFGEGGGAREARRLGVPLLAQVPIEMEVRAGGDRGKPVVFSHPASASARAFTDAASALKKALGVG